MSREAGSALLACPIALAAWLAAAPASAQDTGGGSCQVVRVEMTPSADLQMVVWIEDTAGNYVETAFITRVTGTHGLGNRPGIMEFNTAWRWPYGRRTSTFPVWAHRHGMEFPRVVFQDEDDDDLSHPLAESSVENFYCKPLDETDDGDKEMWDAQSCATTVFTDKGVLSDDISLYPPREDIAADESRDDPSVAMFDDLNPFDAVSRATPAGGQPFELTWPVPPDLPDGDYVAFVEVSKELDQNEHYDYPEPTDISWQSYGIPYRGQPSVIYEVPFTVAEDADVQSTREYAGYGDPDGLDGDVRAPDGTITTGEAGSGAGRLLLTMGEEGEMYRVRVVSEPEPDAQSPGPIGQLQPEDLKAQDVTLSFLAAGDDGDAGSPAGYEVRYTAGAPMTRDTFLDATDAGVTMPRLSAGAVQSFSVAGLVPSTTYYIGVRAFDECLNYGPLEVLEVTTPRRVAGKVDACFVATAAYGSKLADDVEMLRRFRDVALRSHVVGELLVETYYTFGPALAAVIEPSATLRRAARAALAPAVTMAREVVELAPGLTAPR